MLLCAMPPAKAEFFDYSKVSGRLCLTGAEVGALMKARDLYPSGLQKWAVSGDTFSITTEPSDYMIALPNGVVVATGRILASSVSCRSPNQKRRLATFRVPANYIDAYDLVRDYRAKHRWPLGSAEMTASSAETIIEAYGTKYIVVVLTDWVRRVNTRGDVLLGCAGSENYRIDRITRQVLAFDWCVESHPHDSLPDYSQLPE